MKNDEIHSVKKRDQSNQTVNENVSSSNYSTDEDEIDLREVFLYVKNNSQKIIKITIAFFLLGVLVAIFSPVEYTASVKLLPQKNSIGNNAAKGLLQSFGLGNVFSSASDNMETLSPTLYPDVVKSTPFMTRLIDQKVYFSNLDTAITINNYFQAFYHAGFLKQLRKYTIGLPSLIIRWTTGPNKNTKLPVSIYELEKNTGYFGGMDDSIHNSTEKLRTLNRAELSVIGKLSKRIEINNSGETIELTVKMPDPVAAAFLTQKAVDYLTEYITDYKISKVKLNLEFIRDRYDDSRKQFVEAQSNLAKFRDEHLNINTASARSEEQRLQAEYDLAYNLYKSLAQQLEQAKIQVQEETPAFNVLEPVQIPIEKSEPNVIKILVLFVFLGVFVGIGYLILVNILGKFKTAIE